MTLSKLSSVLILLVLGLSINSASHAQSPPPSQSIQNESKQNHPKKKAPAKQEQRGTKGSPIFVEIKPPDNASKESENAQRIEQEETAERRHHEIITATYRGIYASSAQAVGLIITIGIMIWTAHRQLRAYMAIDGEQPLLQDRDNGVEVTLRVTNVGKTPAFEMMNRITVDFAPFPPSREVWSVGPGDGGKYYLAPGQFSQMSAIFDGGIRIHNIDSSKTHRLYVWGEIHYRTLFKFRRHVKYRFMYEPGSKTDLHYCDNGNEAN